MRGEQHAELDPEIWRGVLEPRGVQLHDALQRRDRQRILSLEDVQLGEAQVRADEGVVELDGLLEQCDAVVEPILSEADRAEDGVRCGASGRIVERALRLQFRVGELPLLNEACGGLERLRTGRARGSVLRLGVRARKRAGSQQCAHEGRSRSDRSAPPSQWSRGRSRNP